MSTKRVAIGGISNEGCSFSPVQSDVDDFAWLYDVQLLARYPFVEQHKHLVPFPLVWARAIPGGPVTRQVYTRFKQEFLQRLQQSLPYDGVYLDLHGALFVEGMQDAEGDFVTAVRELVGADCLISASYDLHGNLSQRVVDHVDMITAYRTAPHIDEAETRERAFSLLMRSIDDQQKPYQRYIRVPVMLPGEQTATTWEPGMSIYQQLPSFIDGDNVWDASVLVGYAWADEPRTSAAIIALGANPTAVDEVAQTLARTFWNARREFRFGSHADSIEDCVHMARNARTKPVFISDTGDNITGGGVGDTPLVLAEMLRQGVENALFASIVDAQAIQCCFETGVGHVVHLNVGGKRDTRHASPLPITGKITSLYADNPANHHAIIQIDGVTLVLTERRTAFLTPQQFLDIGIDLPTYDIIGIKLGYLSPQFSAIAGLELLALSPGVIHQSLQTIAYQHIQRPIFPLDPDMSWQTEDGR